MQEFKDFGAVTATIWIIVAFLLLITILINTKLNALQIEKNTNCLIKLGASIFHFLINIILRKADRTSNNQQEKSKNDIKS